MIRGLQKRKSTVKYCDYCAETHEALTFKKDGLFYIQGLFWSKQNIILTIFTKHLTTITLDRRGDRHNIIK